MSETSHGTEVGFFQRLTDVLFLLLIVFVPVTKLGIPAIGNYELTLGDMIMFTLLGLFLITKRGIHRSYVPYILALILYFFLVHLSIVNSLDYFKYLKSSIPHFFAVSMALVVVLYFSSLSNQLQRSREAFLERISSIRNVLIFSLLMSSLPVYYQLLSGTKILLFYDQWGWRYSFLAQNPNQYGVYFILYLFLITIITLKFFKHQLKSVFLFELLFVFPALFSGSKTTTLIYFLNLLVIIGILTYYSTAVKRIKYLGISGVILVVAIPFVMSYVTRMSGQITRALSIFEKLSSSKRFQIGGQTGASIDEGWEVFKMYPIFGVGLGNKTAIVGVHEIHNTYLKYLAETGLIGMIGFLIVFFLPAITIFSSRSSLILKLTMISFYVLFAMMNVPHMLYRQRWVWLFISLIVVLCYWDSNGHKTNSRFTVLN